ncbi:MAG: ion channel [Planctomycetota bacterium]
MAFSRFFRSTRLDASLVSTAIGLYLLLGSLGTLLFQSLEALEPGSFVLGNGGRAGAADLHYFSFVTMTTVGYGDITPSSAIARSGSLTLAIVGQMYLVVVLGRLVGLQHKDDQDEVA